MKVIFLDRDGVINKYPGDKKYVTSCKEFIFLPKARNAIARLCKKRFTLFVISNQAGVGKGIYTRQALDAITAKMLREIRKSGGRIKTVYYCTHRKNDRCLCRKPKTGLIDIAKKRYSIETEKSFFIGDSIRDVKTAKGAGCKSILVLSGKEKSSNHKKWKVRPDFVFRDLNSAADFILNRK